MGPLLLASLLFAAPQVDEKFIPRVSKDAYLSAVRELNKAADLISEDPQSAAEKVTSILGNSKIRHFECRLNIEVAPSIKDSYDFFPYQIRGKARMAWAKKMKMDAAESLYVSAVEDLRTSRDKKVPGSAELLKEAETLLTQTRDAIEKARSASEDPLKEFKKKFSGYLSDGKFKSAANLAQSGPDSQKMTEEQRQSYLADADEKCRDFCVERISKFRQALADTSVRTLRGLTESEFRSFTSAIPPEAEITDKSGQDPTLQWIRKHVKTLRSIQAKQAKVDEILAAAAEALKLDAPDTDTDNPWFKAMASLAYEMCESSIRNNTRDSLSAPKAERASLQGAADQLHGLWKSFAEKLDKKVLALHPDVETWSGKLGELVKSFPVELTNLDGFDIDGAFKIDPVPALSKIETDLVDLESNLGLKGPVAIESRKELYTKLITAGALRRLIQGDSEDKVAAEFRLSGWGRKLRDVGGPTNAEKYGPRVKYVFDRVVM